MLIGENTLVYRDRVTGKDFRWESTSVNEPIRVSDGSAFYIRNFLVPQQVWDRTTFKFRYALMLAWILKYLGRVE